ncbi:uroporphyrinogen-III synthase [Virgibacillus dakarensis]|uniref:Uroporphyrinogen-III synthase n=1 Tax=Lentibacillus populi TaxID=1827502 RepID=A0A9W5TUH6_9BACI|nr:MULTISPECIES: uroporphyrinogen-III synthase [Bacillaceae]MBT2215165.1 uroporphyrinogen-III synthase [Virgibacillus dakarensis]MTW84217.1 uroporphyrinogen-III synthase [Virgibacillus dakarensis]GGB28108.1 uroporphyrinogen-III synthase [Lentibacillus populi]
MPFSLHGKRILITREKNQAKELSEKVSQFGGQPIEAPLLKITCKKEAGHMEMLENLPMYRWIFFTSANGVRCFFQIMSENNVSYNLLEKTKLAVVGHKTEDALKKYGYAAEFIPSTYNAAVMAEEILTRFPSISPVLLIRGNRSRQVLPEQLAENNISFDIIEVYETIFNQTIKDRLNELISNHQFDMITFTSPSTVEAFIEMNEAHKEEVKKVPCACIGTTTEQKAKWYGFTNTIVPEQFTIEGMVEKMCTYISQKG